MHSMYAPSVVFIYEFTVAPMRHDFDGLMAAAVATALAACSTRTSITANAVDFMRQLYDRQAIAELHAKWEISYLRNE